MSSRQDTPEPGTSDAHAGRAGPAAPQGNEPENPACPECWDASTACSGSCRHCFCPLCLWDWSLGQAACPRCRRPTRHPYPQHLALYHEVQERAYDGKRRWRGSGRFGRGRARERRRGRSVRWPRDGRRWSRPSRGSGSPRRRWWWWWRQRRAWEDTHGEGRGARFEASSRGSRSRRERSPGRRRWSRGRERARGWDRRQDGSSGRGRDTQTGAHDDSARQRRWRSRNADDRHAARPQHDVPSRRSERRQWEDSDSSRHRHARRRRSRGRSRRRGQNSQAASQGTMPRDRSGRQSRWRSRNAEQGRAPRSRRDIPGSSGRSRHRRRSRSRAGHRDT